VGVDLEKEDSGKPGDTSSFRVLEFVSEKVRISFVYVDLWL
jgi:hypothetical protein